jgi:hypothetical protein
MRKKLSALVVMVAMSSTMLAFTGGSATAQPAVNLDLPPIPITGTATEPVAGAFAGTFDLERIARQGGQLVAIGDLTGNITPTAGGALVPVNVQDLAIPIGVAEASCEILDLTLGPLHLDLLGLVIDLNQVHLTITAVPGAGNLLGNLLCAIAGLLDGPATPLNALTQLLNQLLGLLG